MLKQLSLSISLALLLIGSCASPTGDPTGTGGAGGTSSPPPPGLGQGGPFPFPQNKTSGACTITTVASTSAMQNAYSSWKSSFVTSSGAGSGVRVQSPQHSGGT